MHALYNTYGRKFSPQEILIRMYFIKYLGVTILVCIFRLRNAKFNMSEMTTQLNKHTNKKEQ
jgi:hypothetical protein